MSLKVLLPIWIILISSFCLILGPIFQLQLWKCMVRMDILVELPFLIWSCLKPIHFYHTAVYIIIQYRNSLMNCTWYIATFRLLSMCTRSIQGLFQIQRLVHLVYLLARNNITYQVYSLCFVQCIYLLLILFSPCRLVFFRWTFICSAISFANNI